MNAARLTAMDTVHLDDHDTLHIERRTPWTKIHESSHWWLTRDGRPVAYLHTLRHLRRDTHQFVLCDIEVRDTHRRQGLAHRIIDAAQTIQGEVLYTSGGFTPLGAAALGWVTLMPGQTPGVHYADMPFVEDWDQMRALNPL